MTHTNSTFMAQADNEMLIGLLRSGTDPASLCPACNIESMTHCQECGRCNADPLREHSFLLGTCITVHNRAYFISMVAAALCCDLVLMMIALLNF